jgi:hypothetical protein
MKPTLRKVYCSDSYQCAQSSDVCPYKLTSKIEKEFIEKGLTFNMIYMAYNCECYIPLEQESSVWI